MRLRAIRERQEEKLPTTLVRACLHIMIEKRGQISTAVQSLHILIGCERGVRTRLIIRNLMTGWIQAPAVIARSEQSLLRSCPRPEQTLEAYCKGR